MTTTKNFLETWRRVSCNFKKNQKKMTIPVQSVRGSVRDIEELIATVDYISGASELMKKTPRHRRSSFERDVQLRARRARSLGRSVIMMGLDTIRHHRAVGMLDESFEVWKNSIADAGQVSVHDIWNDVMKMEGVSEKLLEHGFSEDLLNRIDSTLGEHDQIHSIDKKGRLQSKAKKPGKKFIIRDLPGPTQDWDLGALLSKNKFDMVASRIGQPGRVAMDVVVREWKDGGVPEIDLLDGVLAASILSMRDLNRQVEELDEAGIPEHEGGLFWIIPLVIGGIALAVLLAAQVCWAVCLAGGDDGAVCDAAMILTFIAVAFIAAVLISTGVGALATVPVLAGIVAGVGILVILADAACIVSFYDGTGEIYGVPAEEGG